MALTPEQIERAIARIPEQSNTSIKQVMENAKRASAGRLVEACEAELRARGTLDLTAETAKLAVSAAARTAGKSLAEVIEIAFKDVPAKPEEIQILRWIAKNPGTTFKEIEKIYGRNDLSLVIGHFIYYRFGYFRPFINSTKQSDIMLARTMPKTGVCYTLRPEATEALGKLGII